MALVDSDGKPKAGAIPLGVSWALIVGLAFHAGSLHNTVSAHNVRIAQLEKDREVTASMQRELAKIGVELAAANGRLARIEARLDRPGGP